MSGPPVPPSGSTHGHIVFEILEHLPYVYFHKLYINDSKNLPAYLSLISNTLFFLFSNKIGGRLKFIKLLVRKANRDDLDQG